MSRIYVVISDLYVPNKLCNVLQRTYILVLCTTWHFEEVECGIEPQLDSKLAIPQYQKQKKSVEYWEISRFLGPYCDFCESSYEAKYLKRSQVLSEFDFVYPVHRTDLIVLFRCAFFRKLFERDVILIGI